MTTANAPIRIIEAELKPVSALAILQQVQTGLHQLSVMTVGRKIDDDDLKTAKYSRDLIDMLIRAHLGLS